MIPVCLTLERTDFATTKRQDAMHALGSTLSDFGTRSGGGARLSALTSRTTAFNNAALKTVLDSSLGGYRLIEEACFMATLRVSRVAIEI